MQTLSTQQLQMVSGGKSKFWSHCKDDISKALKEAKASWKSLKNDIEDQSKRLSIKVNMDILVTKKTAESPVNEDRLLDD